MEGYWLMGRSAAIQSIVAILDGMPDKQVNPVMRP